MNTHRCFRWLVVAIAAIGSITPGPALRAEVVRFTTADGIEIVGDYHAPPKDAAPAPVAILLHMYGSSRSSWGPLIEKLGTVINEVGRENNFSLILRVDAPSLVYKREALDITDLVIKTFNRKG